MKSKDILKPKSHEKIISLLGDNPIITELNKIPKNQWAEIHCIFNCWKIPDSLKNLKCNEFKNYYGLSSSNYFLIKETMRFIEYMISEKEFLRYWNVEHKKFHKELLMTEKQFDRWYNKNHE